MNIYKLKLQLIGCIFISEHAAWNTGSFVINGIGTANGESIETTDFVLFNNDGERFEKALKFLFSLENLSMNQL